jgi:AcrR family transcriptional regulator
MDTSPAARPAQDSRGEARTPRQRRADETRARVFAAACDLFLTQGYHATSVDSIAARAGVAKGTFFVHFKTKAAVITELVRIQTSAARRARARALATSGPIEALRAAVMTLGKHAATSRTLSGAVLAATIESREVGGSATDLFDEIFADMLEDARAAARAHLLLPHVDADGLAWSLMASYLGSALHFTSSPRARPLVEVLTPLVESALASALAKTKKKPAKKSASKEKPHGKVARSNRPRAVRRAR